MNDFQIDWQVRIPLRDGIRLNATIYRPLGKDSVPAIVSMTPYNTDTYHERGTYFAARGFAFALVDVRGRGSSEGEFEPFVTEGRDGHDVVEWISGRPWCSGRAGMWGGSYAGMAQWYTAAEAPAHLATIAPAAASWVGLELPFPGGIYNTWAIQWLTLTCGKTVQWNAMADLAYWTAQFRRRYDEHRPFAELGEAVGNTGTKVDRWLEHPTLDRYWSRLSPTSEHFARMQLPVLSVTGLFDGATIGVFEFYKQHVASVSAEIADRHFLIVGPWDHAGTRSPRSSVGELTFGPQSLLDLGALHCEWYAWSMCEGPKPRFFRDRIAYYVTGLEEWRFAHTLDEMSTGRRVFFLSAPGGEANDAFHSGFLLKSPGASAPASYAYDPLDIRPGELQRLSGAGILTDQTAALNLFGNGLVYHSEQLGEDCVFVGEPLIVLFIAIDVPDTDIAVSLHELRPNGTSVLMGGDRLRARFRESLEREAFVRPGEIYEYRFAHLKFVSRLVRKQSRIRLIVSSPNSIFEQKNYNSGGDPRYETRADARIARITLYHGEAQPSRVELPLGELTCARRLADEDAPGFFLAAAETPKPQG